MIQAQSKSTKSNYRKYFDTLNRGLCLALMKASGVDEKYVNTLDKMYDKMGNRSPINEQLPMSRAL